MIGTIETAVLARLRSASTTGLLGYRLKNIESYGGEFDGPEELKRVLSGLPGAFVVFLGDEQTGDRGNGCWMMRPTFAVLVAAQNKRNEASRRQGAVGDVGSYQMALDVRTLLANQTLGLNIEPLTPLKIRPFPLAKTDQHAVSILAVEFRTGYVLEGAQDALTATLPATLKNNQALLPALMEAAGVTDFKTAAVDWEPSPMTDTIDLEAS